MSGEDEPPRVEKPPLPDPVPQAVGRPSQPKGVRVAPHRFRRAPVKPRADFFPLEARTWSDAGIDPTVVEGIVLRHLLGAGSETGRNLAAFVKLPLSLVQDVLDKLKERKFVNYRGTTAMGDFVTELTDAGAESALQSRRMTSYVGPAPVPWDHYLEALRYQALAQLSPKRADLERAFADLHVNDDLLDRLGPAVCSGQALFLFGEPGNGKTSLAERMTRCFVGDVWLPVTLEVGGHLVKLFDPAVHRVVETEEGQFGSRVDRRWVRIERPTVLAGGELTLQMLEVLEDETHNICEAPLHLKANMGTFVVDDFGRGMVSPLELLNRWILPLEKRLDFMTMPDGRKFACPFDCLLVFSTNLEPRNLADEALLRRIPYKIYVGDPLADEFMALVVELASKLEVRLTDHSVKYLVERHFTLPKRPMRMCHARDLLQQVVHLCEFEGRERAAGPEEWDRVVQDFFGF